MILSRIQSALAKAIRLTTKFPMITAVDYGPAYKNGKAIKTFAIRFHVSHKLPLSEFSEHYALPTKIDNVRCDVIEATYAAQGAPEYFCDELQPGLSVGNIKRGTTGTLGPLVVDKVSGRTGFISCWHVLCGSVDAKPGEVISQPGLAHLGTNLSRNSAVLERFLSLNHGYDAALALFPPTAAYTPAPWGGSVQIRGVEKPRQGMKVFKIGAITGGTIGSIETDTPGPFEIDYRRFGDELRKMKGYRISLIEGNEDNELSVEGDSGSLWINIDTGNAVALNFGGEDGKGPTFEYAVAHSLPEILTRLNVDIYTG